MHLACQDSPNATLASGVSAKNFPTVLWEPSSGVPGSLAILETPLIPASINSSNPGRWLFDLQEKGELGRVCIWDRPGYGFSEVMNGADLGKVADALYLALHSAQETKKAKKRGGFVLVGEGYGGWVILFAHGPRCILTM